MPENSIPEEIRSKAVAASEALYRLSELKNFDAALKFELRKKSTEIFSRLAGLAIGAQRRSYGAAELLADIAAIQELIRFAAGRLYITQENAEKVLGAYRHISDGIQGLFSEAEAKNSGNSGVTPKIGAVGRGELNERQQRIMEYVASNGQVQISDIRRIFGEECSEKTLQRDLWQLANSGLILRQGDYRWTTYSIGH